MILQSHVTNISAHTLLLDCPTGTNFLNSIYSVPSTTKILNHIKDFIKDIPSSVEVINNVYELPSIEQSVRYIHVAVGFPTKATWIKSILMGNYLTWPLLTVNHVNKFFPGIGGNAEGPHG